MGTLQRFLSNLLQILIISQLKFIAEVDSRPYMAVSTSTNGKFNGYTINDNGVVNHYRNNNDDWFWHGGSLGGGNNAIAGGAGGNAISTGSAVSSGGGISSSPYRSSFNYIQSSGSPYLYQNYNYPISNGAGAGAVSGAVAATGPGRFPQPAISNQMVTMTTGGNGEVYVSRYGNPLIGGGGIITSSYNSRPHVGGGAGVISVANSGLPSDTLAATLNNLNLVSAAVGANGWGPAPALLMDTALQVAGNAALSSSHLESVNLSGTNVGQPALATVVFGSDSNYNHLGGIGQGTVGGGAISTATTGFQNGEGHINGAAAQLYQLSTSGDQNHVAVFSTSDALGNGAILQDAFSGIVPTSAGVAVAGGNGGTVAITAVDTPQGGWIASTVPLSGYSPVPAPIPAVGDVATTATATAVSQDSASGHIIEPIPSGGWGAPPPVISAGNEPVLQNTNSAATTATAATEAAAPTPPLQTSSAYLPPAPPVSVPGQVITDAATATATSTATAAEYDILSEIIPLSALTAPGGNANPATAASTAVASSSSSDDDDFHPSSSDFPAPVFQDEQISSSSSAASASAASSSEQNVVPITPVQAPVYPEEQVHVAYGSNTGIPIGASDTETSVATATSTSSVAPEDNVAISTQSNLMAPPLLPVPESEAVAAATSTSTSTATDSLEITPPIPAAMAAIAEAPLTQLQPIQEASSASAAVASSSSASNAPILHSDEDSVAVVASSSSVGGGGGPAVVENVAVVGGSGNPNRKKSYYVSSSVVKNVPPYGYRKPAVMAQRSASASFTPSTRTLLGPYAYQQRRRLTNQDSRTGTGLAVAVRQ